MDTKEAIIKRRSIKHYDASFKMPEQDKQELLNLAINSPTSFNIQNWRFVVVEDTEKRNAIKDAAWGQSQITDASLLLILCADIKAWEKQPERYWKNAPQEVQDMIVPMIKNFYDGRDWIQRDEAMRSIGFAAQTIMIAAKSMGYDTCPMIGFDQDKVAEIIKLPKDHVIGMLLVVGKAAKDTWPKPGQLNLNEIIFKDTF